MLLLQVLRRGSQAASRYYCFQGRLLNLTIAVLLAGIPVLDDFFEFHFVYPLSFFPVSTFFRLHRNRSAVHVFDTDVSSNLYTHD